VFSPLEIIGDHLNAGFQILGGNNKATRNIVVDRVIVDGVRGNGFRIQAGDQNSTATVSDIRITASKALNNKPISGGVRVCSGEFRCRGGGNDGLFCDPMIPEDCPNGTCVETPSADGLVIPDPFNRTTNLEMSNFESGNNGDDGVDIINDFSQLPGAPHILLDSTFRDNCKAGIRTWHSVRIENAYVHGNDDSGIAVTRHDLEDDISMATAAIIGSTIVGNARSGGSQITLLRNRNLTARIYNTIAASMPGLDRIALNYSRSDDDYDLKWDYDHFYRVTSGNDVVRYTVGGQTFGCNHTQLAGCDEAATGSHLRHAAAALLLGRC